MDQLARGLFTEPKVIDRLLDDALARAFGLSRQVLSLRRPLREVFAGPGDRDLAVHGRDTAAAGAFGDRAAAEGQPRGAPARHERGQRRLLRNLAHEIKNPLGGIRGAAQLLETELRTPGEREYTGVIIAEADRLQGLVDRVLASHRAPRVVADLNIHEVCERVRAVIMAEYPNGLLIDRDYDASVPEFRGDREQLIQAL